MSCWLTIECLLPSARRYQLDASGAMLMDSSANQDDIVSLEVLLLDQAARLVAQLEHLPGIAISTLAMTDLYNLDGDDGMQSVVVVS